MCRNIKRLHNIQPIAEPAEVRDAALQFVRKIAGTRRPSIANAAAFERAVDEIAAASERLLAALRSAGPPVSRDDLASSARARRERNSPTRHAD